MKYADELILVGNGPSVMYHRVGALIDQFGTVARINNFVTEGYELVIGGRTDIWVMNAGPCVRPRDVSGFREVIGCAPCFDRQSPLCTRYIDAETVHCVRWEFARFEPVKFPSTGLFALAFLLNGRNRIFIHGFDHFARGQHHYFEGGGDPSPHRGEAERQLIQEWVDAGRVVRLLDAEQPKPSHA